MKHKEQLIQSVWYGAVAGGAVGTIAACVGFGAVGRAC